MIFPDYIVEKDKKFFTFKSKVYVLIEEDEKVRVYLYPVSSTYVCKSKKQEHQNLIAHLKECLRLSKYINTDLLLYPLLEFVTIIEKDDPSFLDKIHYQYL